MAVAESQVAGIISALNDLEGDIDSLDGTVSDMKRQMSILVQKETDILYEKTRAMATAEAEGIIGEARRSAEKKAAQISEKAAAQLEQLRKDIDAGFEDAVDAAVNAILKR